MAVAALYSLSVFARSTVRKLHELRASWWIRKVFERHRGAHSPAQGSCLGDVRTDVVDGRARGWA